jgi:predicted nucleic acid-binding Zn finger protein
MVTTTILAKADGQRLQKAVEELVSRAYTIALAGQSESEMRGFVTNGDGKQYGLVLSEEHAFCSCPDAMYRRSVCKHAVALALYVIRTLKVEIQPAETEAEEQPVNLKLGKVRKDFAFSA